MTTPANAATWRCPHCTTLNASSEPACIVCHQARPTANSVGPAAVAPPAAVAGSPPPAYDCSTTVPRRAPATPTPTDPATGPGRATSGPFGDGAAALGAAPSPDPSPAAPERTEPAGRTRRGRPLTAVAVILAIGLVVVVAVFAARGTGGDDAATVDSGAPDTTARRATTTTSVTTSTVPTPAEEAAAELGGTFVGGSTAATACEGFVEARLTWEDGTAWDCPGFEDLEVRSCSTSVCHVNIASYDVQLQFVNGAWSGQNPQAPSIYADCDGGRYDVAVSVNLSVTQAVEDPQAASGWRATELRGTLTEESVGDCTPLRSVVEFFEFRQVGPG